jgi:hypothetical protein
VFFVGADLTFIGNTVHANVNHGVSILPALGTPGGSVRLGPTACDLVDAHPNQFYCYGANNLGVVAYDGVAVNAQDNRWNEEPPVQNVDFGGATLLTTQRGTVSAAPSCGAASMVCR